ncbi:hypothetical protein BS78_05G078800 [Paspalum vaginatum]|nr:hypothetical protein BS78_05G078800 [Paspalum vaginatum]
MPDSLTTTSQHISQPSTMASTKEPEPSVTGPVPLPFKDADVDDDAVQDPQLKEYKRRASELPSNPTRLRTRLRCYQGTWVLEQWVPGIMAIQRGFAPRQGDVIVASPPKCGTTWLKALTFATMARGVYPPTHAAHPLLRLNPHDCVPFMENLFAAGLGSKMDALPSPRVMATHMHHSVLPASIRANPECKIVYICRDPKDMLVSMWHFARRLRPDVRLLDDMFEPACDGSGLSGPIWNHVLGYWNASKASPETVLFLRYEEMLRDPVGNVKKLAHFVRQPFSPAEEEAGVVTDIVGLCSFEKLKNLEVNMPSSDVREGNFPKDSYFRRGVTRDWANHMTPEMAARLDAVMEEKLRGSGLSFSSLLRDRRP